jgi:hypothetical protein
MDTDAALIPRSRRTNRRVFLIVKLVVGLTVGGGAVGYLAHGVNLARNAARASQTL